MLYEAIDDDTIELNVINCFVSRASSTKRKNYWKLMKYFRSKNSNCIQKKWINVHELFMILLQYFFFFDECNVQDIWFTNYSVVCIKMPNITPPRIRPAFNWTIIPLSQVLIVQKVKSHAKIYGIENFCILKNIFFCSWKNRKNGSTRPIQSAIMRVKLPTFVSLLSFVVFCTTQIQIQLKLSKETRGWNYQHSLYG